MAAAGTCCPEMEATSAASALSSFTLTLDRRPPLLMDGALRTASKKAFMHSNDSEDVCITSVSQPQPL